jgi:hypothetical protein
MGGQRRDVCRERNRLRRCLGRVASRSFPLWYENSIRRDPTDAHQRIPGSYTNPWPVDIGSAGNRRVVLKFVRSEEMRATKLSPPRTARSTVPGHRQIALINRFHHVQNRGQPLALIESYMANERIEGPERCTMRESGSVP